MKSPFFLKFYFAINGVIVNVIKLCVGRPRPDFFYRFSQWRGDSRPPCNGDPDVITDGEKSFPSGHTACKGCLLGFAYLSLYLAGKPNCFSQEGKSQSWRLIAVFNPSVSATVVGLSRIQDNMHHWE
ncbi:LOW QUALITY PROTEIN: phospholipid phosphatase 5-like, partial [Gigantopelta aegis]|uniref:LOW QUALITY PROTEIN: phospholipid phosphatase 5-like n=1 Tax=Gigantopelta aegis TaxID=1735272 RepID=UPI001B88E291